MLKHIDLFSGIGGFAYAIDQVWDGVEHIFVEYDPFCQLVLKKHWPNSYIHGDIRTFTNTRSEEQRGISGGERQEISETGKVDILTGGFPCQPFSQAGRRKGTGDDRYLWPEMFRVIRDWQPAWVIAENVRGLATWNEGMVLEQVCTDLESEGYEVQPLIIPAVSVNAPHRRDRIWFIANRTSGRERSGKCERNSAGKSKIQAGDGDRDDADTELPRLERGKRKAGQGQCGQSGGVQHSKEREAWNQNWFEVATRLCRMDDGLPRRMDRNPRLKALGNAIVPEVAKEIIKAIPLHPNIR